jgi:hypothetical protein
MPDPHSNLYDIYESFQDFYALYDTYSEGYWLVVGSEASAKTMQDLATYLGGQDLAGADHLGIEDRPPEGNPLDLHPSLSKAHDILLKALAEESPSERILQGADAYALLKGYALTPDAWSKYQCSFCAKKGVKLWRSVGSSVEAWCSACGTSQAGLPDNADANGRVPSTVGGGMRTDQIYSSKKGLNLLPWVPCPDVGTWGYTSVPPEGGAWWRALPTR